MANPFTVQPAQYGQGLAGLGQSLAQAGQIKQQRDKEARLQQAEAEQKAELEEVFAQAEEALVNKDYDAINTISIRYPKVGENVLKALGADDERKQKNIIETGFKVLQNPENYDQIIDDNPIFAEQMGGADLAKKTYAENPEKTLDQARQLLAWTGGDQWKQFREYEKGEKPEIKVGRFQYKDTPDGFLKVDSATGEEETITIGSKAYKTIQDRKIAEIDKELELEGKIFDKSKKVRDRYDTKAKEFIAVKGAYDRIEASVEEPDAAGDIALIFNYMKMLDPGSVVREGEFATAQNAGGVDDSIRNMYNKLADGERLQPKQREMFANRAKKLFKKAEFANQKDRAETLNIGKRYGLTEADIFGDGSIYPAGDNAGVTIETNVTDMSDEDLMKELEGR